MLKDFKTFIMRGNVMDLAVGVIIGAAFGKIVSSLVADVLTPLISIITGGIDLTSLHAKIGGSIDKSVYLAYGSFIQAFIDFLIIALVIFLLVRFMSRFQKSAPAPTTTKECPRCKMSINKDATRCPHCTSELN